MNYLRIMILILPFSFGCVKKYGCTDKLAFNFDPEAAIMNYTCNYKEVLRIATHESKIVQWNENGIDSLSFYFDDELVAERPVDLTLNGFSFDVVTYEKPHIFHILVVGNNGEIVKEKGRRTSSNTSEVTINI